MNLCMYVCMIRLKNVWVLSQHARIEEKKGDAVTVSMHAGTVLYCYYIYRYVCNRTVNMTQFRTSFLNWIRGLTVFIKFLSQTLTLKY